jgi:alpha-L-arabinofuranosidase
MSTSLLNVAKQNNRALSPLQVSRWRNGGTVRYGNNRRTYGEGMLATSVSTGGTQCSLVVKVANYGQASALINVQLPEYKGPLQREVDLHWITGLAPTDRNSMEKPRQIRIQQKRIPVNMSAREVALFVPSFSMSVLCLQLLSETPMDVL